MSNAALRNARPDGEDRARAALREALDALAEAARCRPGAGLEEALIDLRITGFRSLTWPAPDVSPPRPAAPVPNGELAEIQAAELNHRVLRDAVLGGAGLIVRGLMDARRVQEMCGHIDAALAARSAAHHGEGDGGGSGYYRRSPHVQGGPQQFWARHRDDRFAEVGSLWAADSPVAARFMADFYRDIGLPALLRECLGEEAVLSVKKWVLRKVAPKTDGQSGWHQDGRFLGNDISTVNLWVALSDCGGDSAAPGMEIIADQRKRIHETGTGGAMFDWVVGPDLVRGLTPTTPVLTPRFQPGDALFFDHYNLHRTQCCAAQTDLRYAVESWFFAASRAPVKQMPLLL